MAFSHRPPSHGHARVGQATKTYLQQLCTDIGCSLEELQGVMDDEDEWQQKVKKSVLAA